MFGVYFYSKPECSCHWLCLQLTHNKENMMPVQRFTI
jgi:hypothetical protein